MDHLTSKRNQRNERANSNIMARAEKVRANSITYNEKVEKAYEDREIFMDQKLAGY